MPLTCLEAFWSVKKKKGHIQIEVVVTNLLQNPSLLGVADVPKFADPMRPEQTLGERRLHAPTTQKLRYTVIVVVVSAVVFVTAVALYDALRNAFNYVFLRRTLAQTPLAPDENQRALQNSLNGIYASLSFAGACIVIALLVTPPLLVLARHAHDK